MRLTVAIGLLAAANVLVSFAFLWYVVATLGAERVSDALFAASVAPQLVMAILTGSIASVATPLLANEDEATRRAWSWYLVRLATLAFLALGLVLGLTAPLWVPLTVPGFEPQAQALTVELTRIQLVAIAPAVAVTLCIAAENARHRFVWAEASGALAGLGSLALLVLMLPTHGVYAAAWAAAVRPLLQALLLLPLLGPYSSARIDARSLRLIWARLRPLIYGAAYYKTDLIVDRVLASLAPSGGLTLLHVAQQIYTAGTTVVSRALASPGLPILANHARDGDWQAFRKEFARRATALLVLTLVTLAVFALVGEPVMAALVHGSRFTEDQVSKLWWLLVALGGMWVGGSVGSVSSSAFYAKGDTQTPTRLSVVTFTVYIPIKIGAFFLFGLLGLAVSITLLYLVNAGLQVALLRRRPARPH
jgi:putative peptidoglycan lipid II flippase